MYLRTIFSFFLFILAILGSLNGQFKSILLNKQEPGYRDKVSIVKQPWALAPSSNEEEVRVSFKPLEELGLLAAKTGLRAGMLTEMNVPAYIEGTLRKAMPKGLSPEVLAGIYLKEAAPLMKISHPEEEWQYVSSETDDLGMTHIRFRQKIGNIPIYGAEVIVHGVGETFDFVNGRYYPSSSGAAEKIILTPEKATELVQTDLGLQVKYTQDLHQLGDMTSRSELVYYWHEGALLPVFHVTAYKNLVDRWEYFVDAERGTVVRKYISICKFHNHRHDKGNCAQHDASMPVLDGKATANSQDLFNINRLINTYEVGGKFFMIDGSRDMFRSIPSQLPNEPEGVIWTIDAFNTSPAKDDFRYDHVTSTNNIWGNKTAVSSHFNGGKAFEYFRNVHNRKSINGNGGNIISLINVSDEDGTSLGNAFWNGQAMFYGNGDGAFLPLARGLDVAGHEMTHGVVQNTANLEYEGESGALNESFADVFGAMIDRDDWKIGEDVVKSAAFPSGALRNMEDPHNGAATNDFNNGWQPRHYNERFKGSQDNGGVHINSGIPNFAFFKIATAIGKDKAEKMYYRALANYLTKSSQFTDCRVAVVKAAGDLFGTSEVNAVRKAFDEVGITGETGGDYEDDVNVNPGTEFILTTGASNTGLFLMDKDGKELAKLSSKTLISKPSVTDDGTVIVYVASDKKLYFTTINWAQGQFTADQSLDNSPIWRSIVISKDGDRIAALFDDKTNQIFVYDFNSNTEMDFELYNPTFTQGVTTGDVLYADAMEFDISGEYIMYDSENQISSNTAGDITYWDISFIRVWDNETDEFGDGRVEKLFTSLPEDVSVGNPSFSKNSPYIICFDYLDEEGNASILGANIERGDVGLLFENNILGYPNFSSKDNRIAFDNEGTSGLNLGVVNLTTEKIKPSGNAFLFTSGKRWAVWFSNGDRNLSGLNGRLEQVHGLTIAGNPVSQLLRVRLEEETNQLGIARITDMAGNLVQTLHPMQLDGLDLTFDLSRLPSGAYAITLPVSGKIHVGRFVKQE